MGRTALGALRTLLASCIVTASGMAWAQVPVSAAEPSPAPTEQAPPPVGPAASADAAIPPDPLPPPPAHQPPPPPVAAPVPAAPQPLPADAQVREEVVRMKARPSTPELVTDSVAFVRRASPWVDWSLTSFYLADRAGNFLNLGAQVGAYVFDNFRVSARLAAPLDEVTDAYGGSSFNFYADRHLRSRALAMLYGVSLGVLITNGRSFVLAPSLLLARTDVEDYGSTLAFALPFEWTSQRHLRVGFEVALGRSFGGTVRTICRPSATTPTCGQSPIDRPTGTSILFQYYMGWTLGHL